MRLAFLLRSTAERLLVYRTGKSQRWFERCYDNETLEEAWAPFSSNFHGLREMWRQATRQNALFLTTAARLNCVQLAPLMQWLEQCIEIVVPSGPIDAGQMVAMQDMRFKDRVLDLLRAVDIRVKDVQVTQPTLLPETRNESAAATPESASARPPIMLLHEPPGSDPIWLESVFESAGTHRLLNLFTSLFAAIDRGKLLLIDEFNTGLHPLIARYLIHLVNDPEFSRRGTQLLLTSHNSTLMDLEILRRDEIWLMELDDEWSSSLAPLVRSSPRKRERVAKGYLRGRYGAVPQVMSGSRPPGRDEAPVPSPASL